MAKTFRRVKRKTGSRTRRKYSRCKTKKRIKQKYNRKRKLVKRSYKKKSRKRIIQDGGMPTNEELGHPPATLIQGEPDLTASIWPNVLSGLVREEVITEETKKLFLETRDSNLPESEKQEIIQSIMKSPNWPTGDLTRYIKEED